MVGSSRIGNIESFEAPGPGSVYTRLHETGTLDDIKSCPYNPSHVMSASRFQTHLIKCREQNPEKAALIDICPYNHVHHVYRDKMEQHMVVCPQYHHFQRSVIPKLKEKKEREARERAESVVSAGQAESDLGIIGTRNRPVQLTKEEQDYLQEWQ